MKQGLTYQLAERKGAVYGHSAAVPLSGAFTHIDILEVVDFFSAEISSTYPDFLNCCGFNWDAMFYATLSIFRCKNHITFNRCRYKGYNLCRCTVTGILGRRRLFMPFIQNMPE